MKNNYLVKLLEKYCQIENPQKTGLLLLDLPTGFGKTYAVQKYIAENYLKIVKDDKKIIYITDLKKNLDFDGIKEKFFITEEQKKKFDRYFIFIDSNVDCILNNLSENRESIPTNIIEHPDFIKLDRELKRYENSPYKDWKIKAKEEIQNIEPKFRQLIWNQLKEKFKTKKQRFDAVKEGEYCWVSKIYPAALSEEKKVFFMSVDKW